MFIDWLPLVFTTVNFIGRKQLSFIGSFKPKHLGLTDIGDYDQHESRLSLPDPNIPPLPASSTVAASAMAVRGVSSAGLITQVHPAASAAAAFRVIIACGKFHYNRRSSCSTLYQETDLMY